MRRARKAPGPPTESVGAPWATSCDGLWCRYRREPRRPGLRILQWGRIIPASRAGVFCEILEYAAEFRHTRGFDFGCVDALGATGRGAWPDRLLERQFTH